MNLSIENLPDDIIIWEIYYRLHKMYMLDLQIEIYEKAVGARLRRILMTDSDYSPSSSGSDTD